jgi:uncharacterized membrane protein
MEKNLHIQKQTEETARLEYPPSALVFIFFTYAFFGWIWEVFLFLVVQGRLINRGILYGPWLPIYGVGAILILLLFRNRTDSPVKLFLMIALLFAALEYGTGWYLDQVWHTRWWDYSNYPLNINGYICVEAITLFALCGVGSLCWLTPKLSQRFSRMSDRTKKALLLALLLVFLADISYSLVDANDGEGNIFPRTEQGDRA